MEEQYLITFCTTPNKQVAKKLAQMLVEEHLAACCNILPNITSVYIWKGAVQNEQESLLIIKTTKNKFRRLEQRILENHPYEVPEIIALPIGEGNRNYLKWINEHVESQI